MGKFVVLRLDGDLAQQGFRVSVEIGDDGHPADGATTGGLPANHDLLTQLRRWQTAYRRLGVAMRVIKPIESSFRASVEPRDACRDAAGALAIAFQAWLNTEAFRPIDAALRQTLQPTDTIRLLIRTDEHTLHSLPWHLWDVLEQYPHSEIAFSAPQFQRMTVTKRLDRGPIKILAILGHRQHIDIEADRQSLASLPGAQVTFLVEPKRQELTDQLWDQAWDILFFAGHSQTEPTTESPVAPRSVAQQGRLFINATESLTVAELKYGLKQAIAQGLQLALFNSCDGLGLAYELEPLHIPQMIVMREPIPDQVAQAFLSYFLHAFSQGKSLYLAEREARERLQALEINFPCASWLPILFQQPATLPLTWPAPVTAPIALWRTIIFHSLATTVATLGVIGLRLTGLLQGSELWAFDRLVAFQPNEDPDPRLLMVEVTDADLRQLGYPLSDQVLTQALTRLETANPTVIGLDIFRSAPREPGHAEFLKYMQQSDRFIAVCQHSSTETQGFAPPPQIPADQVGFNDVLSDPDGIIRRHLFAMTVPNRSDCTPQASFSLLLATHYLEENGITMQVAPAGYIQLGTLILQPITRGLTAYQRADLSGHQLLLHYRRHQNSLDTIAQTVTITQVLNGEVSPNAIRDRVVLIGVTAAEPKDDFATPYQAQVRGLMLHGQMVSQLISAVLDDRPLRWFWPWWGDVLWVGSWALIGGLGVLQSDRRFIFIMSGGAMVVLVGLSWGLLLQGAWVPLVPGAIAFFSSSLSRHMGRRARSDSSSPR